MAFTYRVIERKNTIANAKNPKAAFARAKMLGRVTTKELAEDISDRCTVHRADVVAVLDVMSISVMHYMSKGLGVQLGELGSFSLSVRGKSAATKKDWKPEMVHKAMVRYTPSSEMKTKLAKVGFRNLDDLVEVRTTEGKPDNEESTVTPGKPSTPEREEEPGGGIGGL